MGIQWHIFRKFRDFEKCRGIPTALFFRKKCATGFPRQNLALISKSAPNLPWDSHGTTKSAVGIQWHTFFEKKVPWESHGTSRFFRKSRKSAMGFPWHLGRAQEEKKLIKGFHSKCHGKSQKKGLTMETPVCDLPTNRKIANL